MIKSAVPLRRVTHGAAITLPSILTMFTSWTSVPRESCIRPYSCLHTGDLSLPLFLLKATFLQVGQGAGVPPSEHWEAPDASGSGRELLWRDGAADRTTYRATGYVAVHRQSLETRRDTGVSSKSHHHCSKGFYLSQTGSDFEIGFHGSGDVFFYVFFFAFTFRVKCSFNFVHQGAA